MSLNCKFYKCVYSVKDIFLLEDELKLYLSVQIQKYKYNILIYSGRYLGVSMNMKTYG